MKQQKPSLTEMCLCSSIYASSEDESRFFLEKDLAVLIAENAGKETTPKKDAKSVSMYRLAELLMQESIRKNSRSGKRRN